MAGGKGGSSTTSVEVPQYIEDAAKFNLRQAGALGQPGIAQIGYVPYYGADVAAFTPTQEAAFQNVAGQAGAFGLTTPAGGAMAGMPTPQEFAGGVRGYSSAPMYEQSLGEFARRRPAQFNLIESLFINPVTGEFEGAPVVDATPPPIVGTTQPSIDTTLPVVDVGGGGGLGGGGGTDYVDIGGGQIAVGGDVYNTAGDPFGDLTDQQLQDLADVGLIGTVDYGLNGGTTFIPSGSDMTETEALRDVIGQTSDIDLARLQERADLIAAEAAGSDQSIQDIGLALDDARDQVYGVTAGGTATSRTGMQVADAYDPRAGYFGQPAATDVTQAEDTFGADLYRSLTDPTYDPEGTVLSRALDGLLTPSASSSQPTRLETLGDFVQAAPSMGMTAAEAGIAYEQSKGVDDRPFDAFYDTKVKDPISGKTLTPFQLNNRINSPNLGGAYAEAGITNLDQALAVSPQVATSGSSDLPAPPAKGTKIKDPISGKTLTPSQLEKRISSSNLGKAYAEAGITNLNELLALAAST